MNEYIFCLTRLIHCKEFLDRSNMGRKELFSVHLAVIYRISTIDDEESHVCNAEIAKKSSEPRLQVI